MWLITSVVGLDRDHVGYVDGDAARYDVGDVAEVLLVNSPHAHGLELAGRLEAKQANCCSESHARAQRWLNI